MQLRKVTLLISTGLATWSIPATVRACHPVTVCGAWTVNSTDSDNGEDYLRDATAVPARGVRVTIVPPPPEPPIPTWLDTEGCVEFATQYAYGVKMLVYAESLLGQDDNIYVRAYGLDAVIEESGTNVEVDLDREYAFEVALHGMASGDVVSVALPNSPVTSVLAYATQTVYRIDHELGAHLPGIQRLNVITRLADNARLDFANSGVQVGANVWTRKFVVAHEVGHWFQDRWGASLLFDSFYAPIDVPCQLAPEAVGGSDSALHALRTAEFSSTGMIEGFAHFIAAAAFNDTGQEDGIFTYYKAIDPGDAPQYQDLIDVDYAVALEGGSGAQGGTSRWVDNECPNDWDWPYDATPSAQEVSSEIDWLRFFWAFVASQDAGLGNPADVSDILDVLNATQWTETEVWAFLVNAIENHPDPDVSEHSDRFQDLNDEYGVYNEGP